MTRILIVDDEKLARFTIREILVQAGHKIAEAANGNEAIALQKAEPFDIIVTDLNMPDMDGIEFFRHLSDIDYQGGIVLISGVGRRMLDTAENLAEAHNLNVLGTMEKPFIPAALANILGRRDFKTRGTAKGLITRVSKEELKQGIINDELVVFYQPKVDIATRAVVGVESLVRWKRPESGIVGPDVFIPVAEKYGLIDDIATTVMTMAFRQGGAWRGDGLRLKVAINISMKNLSHVDFPELVVTRAEESGLRAADIILEVTETQLMQDMVTPLEILTRLRLKGVTLSIDDFGTGYSSMEQLKLIPFSEMKIDRAFVQGAAHDPSARAILESSIALAKKLEMTIVAEGAENQEDWNLVADLGVDQVQGYFIAKPMPANELYGWAAEWARKP